MRDWPPITEPELLARLALDDEGFFAAAHEFAAVWGRRSYEPALLERTLGYPWDRPGGSYVLREDKVEDLGDVGRQRRAAIVTAFTEDRHPVLAFGGNAAPTWLTTKFAHFPDPSPLGNMPGTLFASPGTAVRAVMVWCSTAQITQLTWTEVPYFLGRLDDAVFVMDEADVEVEQIFAYISRFGAFCVDDEPVALSAVPAADRTARELTQEELLDLVAPRLIGPQARAEDLVHAIWEDMASVIGRAAETLWPSSQEFQAPWTRFPGLTHMR